MMPNEGEPVQVKHTQILHASAFPTVVGCAGILWVVYLVVLNTGRLDLPSIGRASEFALDDPVTWASHGIMVLASVMLMVLGRGRIVMEPVGLRVQTPLRDERATWHDLQQISLKGRPFAIALCCKDRRVSIDMRFFPLSRTARTIRDYAERLGHQLPVE